MPLPPSKSNLGGGARALRGSFGNVLSPSLQVTGSIQQINGEQINELGTWYLFGEPRLVSLSTSSRGLPSGLTGMKLLSGMHVDRGQCRKGSKMRARVPPKACSLGCPTQSDRSGQHTGCSRAPGPGYSPWTTRYKGLSSSSISRLPQIADQKEVQLYRTGDFRNVWRGRALPRKYEQQS